MPKPTPRYIDWDYETGIAIEYERVGECNQCGACCRAYVQITQIISDSYFKPHKKSEEQGEQVGHSAQYAPPPAENGYPDELWSSIKTGGTIHILQVNSIVPDAGICSALRCDDTGKAICQFHDDKVPLCSTWPLSPRQVEPFPDCSYRFTEIARWSFDPDEELNA